MSLKVFNQRVDQGFVRDSNPQVGPATFSGCFRYLGVEMVRALSQEEIKDHRG